MRLFTLLLLLIASPALALNEGLQCVPYARAVSGIEIRGDAHTWWDQAAGQYSRGSRPRVGAVMSFKPHGAMRLGHVAAVRRIIDNRNVLVSHANWSTIGGQRGHIEENVRVVDVSQDNDWSEVQVWYTPNAALGTTRYPLNGFIYPASQRSDNDVRYAVSQLLGRPATVMAAASVRPDVSTTVFTPKSKAATFQLSYSTLSEVSRKSQNERTAFSPRTLPSASLGAKIAKNKKASIDDLLETLPSPRSVLRSN
jgi:surface antigen